MKKADGELAFFCFASARPLRPCLPSEAEASVCYERFGARAHASTTLGNRQRSIRLPISVRIMLTIMTIYNFKRVMNIFKFDEFLAKLKKWNPDYGRIVRAFLKIDRMLSNMTMPANAIRKCALN